MRGKFRAGWTIVVACSLLLYVSFGAPKAASAAQNGPSFTGRAEVDGPVHLQVNVTPPIGRPRDKITVELTLTSRLEEPVMPAVTLTLPNALSTSLSRYPPATTFDYQQNRVSWQPVLQQNGESQSLTLEYTVAVADLQHPEQRIGIQLAYADTVKDTSVNFWVGTAPSAAILVEQPVVAVGQPVKLQASPSGPGPFTQTWFFSDGRQITASNPEVSFALPGIYEVRLQVANPLAVSSAISAITVVSQPTANFAVDDELPVVGQVVQFSNLSGGERPLQSHWYFGDGAESQEHDPNHTYISPGAYTVRLVITSAHGQSELSLPLSVGANPIADMILPERALTGEPIQAMGFGDDSVERLSWEMGDGRRVEGDVVTHTYHRPGTYTVSLFATNQFGETEVQRQIEVEGGRYASFLPFVLGSGAAAEGAVAGETIPSQPPAPATTDTVPADSAGAEPTGEEPFQGLVEQSGSTLTVPGTEGIAAVPVDQNVATVLPPQAPLAADATAPEQLLWYVNEARRLHGLAPLAYNYELSIAAQHHTVDMAGNPDIMHLGTDGSRPAERQQRFGYLGAYGGEAVAWGWESPVPVVEFWVNSPPHRALILNPYADEIGVGFTADGFAPNIWYWAVEFGVLP